MRSLFVAGTGIGVGKTAMAAALVVRLRREGVDCDSEREQRTWMPSQERLPSRDEENRIGSGFRRRGSAGDRAHRPLQEEPPRPEP